MTQPRPSRSGLLEARVPGLAVLAPRVALATLPTPLTALPDLAARFGLAELVVKRDDLTSGLYGGTKVRALEFFFGAARSQGATSVLTMGSAGSNHAIATAVFAKELGIASRAVLFPHPDETSASSNVARLAALGVSVRRSGWLGLLPSVLRERWSRPGGRRPLWIAPGGSTGLGVLGAAEGALEVVEAARAGAIAMPEVVVVAAGSCGTAAGLALGFALAETPVRVCAVRVVPRLVASEARIRRLARDGAELLRRAGWDGKVTIGEVELVQDQAGKGYGHATPQGLEAVTIAHGAGLPAEPTYTGKALAHVFSGQFRTRRALFWNTYGG